MKIKVIENNNQIKNSTEKNVIVDFYANWCGPCRVLSKTLDTISTEKSVKNVLVLKVNVDDYPDIASEYNVRSLPTLVFLSSGKVIKSKIGNMAKNDLEVMIKEVYEHES